MSTKNNLNDFLKDIADTIRYVGHTTAPINPQDFSQMIYDICENAGGGGASGVPIKVAELPEATADTVGKVYLVDTKVTPEVGQKVGDTLYFDTSKNPLDYPIGNPLLIGESDTIFCTYVDFFELQGITGMGHCYAIGVATLDMSVFLGMPYVYCDALTVDQFNQYVGASLRLSITKFGWQTEDNESFVMVDTTSIKDRRITGIDGAYDFVKVKGGEYYIGEKKTSDFPTGEPVGDKIYFDTAKDPKDYVAFMDQCLIGIMNGSDIYYLAFIDVFAELGVTGMGHCYGLGLATPDMSTILAIPYVFCDMLSVEQFNQMVIPQLPFPMSPITAFGWQTVVLDTSAVADFLVIYNFLPHWDFLAYGETRYIFEKFDGNGIPIVVDTLPVPTVNDIGKVYYNKADSGLYVCGREPLTEGQLVGSRIYYDTNIIPAYSLSDGMFVGYLSTELRDGISYGIAGVGVGGLWFLIASSFIEGEIKVLYANSTELSVEKFNETCLDELGFPHITHFGWQGNGVIDTSTVSNLTIEEIFDPQGIFGGSTPCMKKIVNEPQGELTITQNGQANVVSYASVSVNVQPRLQEKWANKNGQVTADSEYDALSKVYVDVRPVLQDKTVTTDGVIVWADTGYDGLRKVTVDVTPKLYPPVVSLSGSILTVKNPPENEGFVEDYCIYAYHKEKDFSWESLLDNPTATDLSLIPLLLDGTYDISVYVGGISFQRKQLLKPSDRSVPVEYIHEFIPILRSGSTWCWPQTINKSTITEITFDNNYKSTGNETKTWIADGYFDEPGYGHYGWGCRVDCYLNDTSLVIKAQSSTNRVYANYDCSSMFSGFTNLTTINNFEALITSKVTNMNDMFRDCPSLILDCSSWNVDNVTNHTNFNLNAPGVIPPAWVN